jgi:hypothetical protein
VPVEDTVKFERLAEQIRINFTETYGIEAEKGWEDLTWYFMTNSDKLDFKRIYGVDNWDEVGDWNRFTTQVESVLHRTHPDYYEEMRDEYKGVFMWISNDEVSWKTLEIATNDLPDDLATWILDGGEMPDWGQYQIGKPLEFGD